MLTKHVPLTAVPPRTNQRVLPAGLSCRYVWEPADGQDCPLSSDGRAHHCSRQTEHRSHQCDCQAVTYRSALGAALAKGAQS